MTGMAGTLLGVEDELRETWGTLRGATKAWPRKGQGATLVRVVISKVSSIFLRRNAQGWAPALILD